MPRLCLHLSDFAFPLLTTVTGAALLASVTAFPMSQPAPPPDERPATAPSPRQGLTSRSATHRVAAKISLVRDSSVERLDLEHRIAAWKRQSRIAMLERRDFILENRKELPTRTFASVYQRRSKLYVEQCHRGEQARARKSEQIRQVEQKAAEKGLRDAKRLAEVQARRIEQIRLVEQKIAERSLRDAQRHAEVQQRREEASPRCPSNHLSGAAFPPSFPRTRAFARLLSRSCAGASAARKR